METRRSSKRKEREEAPPSGTQQASRKTQRSSAKPSPAVGGESTALAASSSAQPAAQAREEERSNSPSGGPATRLRAKRAAAAAAAPQPVPAAAGRTRRTRTKAREASAEPEEQKLPKEDAAEALPQAAPPTGLTATAAPSAEAGKPSPGTRRLTPTQLRDMANRQGRGQGMDEEKDLAEVFGRNFSGAGSALQGLLRKLGAGFEDMMPLGGMWGSRVKAIMQGLRSTEDEGAQLSSLSELNDLLSISTEDNLAGFPIEGMVPLLIQLLNAEHNPDIMLMAARVLTFLADVLPQSCGAIVRHGAVPAFCARLLTIEYIDLAEQSLQALEKLSHEHSPSLLQNGGLLAVLSYLDFFPTGVQRTATRTAANICRSLTVSASTAGSGVVQAAVKEAIPILTGLLHYSDAKVVDNACVSLSYIAEASAGHPTLLEALTSGGLVGQALQLISLSDSGAMTSQLSLSTYYGLLKLLSTAAASSASVATTLLGTGALATARTLLATSPLLMAGSGTGGGGGGGGSVLLRTPDQLHEVLGLLTELLPPVQDSSTLMASADPVELPGQQSPPPQSGPAAASPRQGNGGAAATAAAAVRGAELLSYLVAHPALTDQLSREVLPLALSSYSATVIPQVRSRALRVLLQLLMACPSAQLREALRDLPLASFLAALLAARDSATLAAALHCCEVLMAQLPDVFKHVFLREGVVHAVEQVAAGAAAAPSSPPLAPVAPPLARASATEEPRRATRASFLSARGAEDKAAAPAAGTGAAAGQVSPAAPAAASAGSRPAPGSPAGATLRSALAARALRFKKAHYVTNGCGAPETEGLVQVRALLQRLSSQPSEALPELLRLLAASSAACGPRAVPSGSAPTASVSVFELLNSGAVKALYDFLTGADLTLPINPSPAAVEERTTAILRRIAALTRAGLTPADGWPCNPPVVGLVRKLQAALSSVETFPVHYGRAAPPSSGGGFRSGGGYFGRGASAGSGPGSALNPGSLSSGLSLLTHPFKLRLCRHSADASLRDYSSNVVLIEPLATMAAIEDFLWPRVYRGAAATATVLAQQQQQQAEQQQEQHAGTGAPGGGAAAAAATEGAAAKGGAGGGAAPAAAAASPPAAASPSRSHPLPGDDTASNRRVTRSQVARERAEAEAEAARRRGAVPVPSRGGNRRGGAAADGKGGAAATAGAANEGAGGAAAAGRDHRMADMGHEAEGEEEEEVARVGRRRTRGGRHIGDGGGGSDHEEEEEVAEDSADGEGDGDAEMEDAGAGGDAMFDEDDEDFDEDAMDGDDGDGDIGNMHVHDLHVDQDMAARGMPALGSAAAAGAALPSGLAAPPAGAAAAAVRPGGAWASRAAASAAEAAVAAAGAAGARGGAAAAASGTGGRSAAHEAAAAKMVFFLAGDERRALASTSTVFQAIQQVQNQQQAAAEADEDAEEEGSGAQRRGRRLWDDVHTLYYRSAGQAEEAADVTAEGGARAAPAAGSAARAAPDDATTAAAAGSTYGGAPLLGRWGTTPLRELLAPRVPADLACSATCREVLALLALLEAVNRLGPRACEELDAIGAGGPEEMAAGPLEAVRHAPRDEFVSAKLSSKLGQQLKDVLSICGGGMPPWCAALAAPCRFLFPFEIRKRYFYCTAFGLGRALQHMQQLHTAEAGGAPGAGLGAADRDGRGLRVGRLQRQKVRVSRKRILESAAKVMELYARSRAVLELEYFNEVGTGLGPTLEFYTLLSHELQRKDLGMWRHEEQDEQQQEMEGEGEVGRAREQGGSPEGEGADREQQQQQQQGPSPLRPSQQPEDADKVGSGREGRVDKMEVDSGADAPAAPAASPPPPPLPLPLQPRGSGPAGGGGGATAAAVPGPASGALVSVPSRRGEAATHEESDYVNAPWGLFPRPLQPAARSTSTGVKVVEHFRLLGRTLAKALQDNRLLDLPLSHVFFAAALGSPLDLWDIARFDPGLGATLSKLHSALAAHRAAQEAGPLLIDGVPLEDLCIAFVLPGQPDYPLRPGGGDEVVSSAQQLGDYIDAVVDATLGSGIAAQMGAFREGFNEVFSLSTLTLFHEDELEVLLCGSGERWTLQLLAEAIKFDHGYTPSSQPVRFLLEILSELDAADQRAFLRFVTGCPRLPPGGLTALQPRLTVVRKHPSGGDGPSNGPTPVGSFQEVAAVAALSAADADLPSVMTCANYIKLPPYSSKAVMAARLMYAIREGQGSFDLS